MNDQINRIIDDLSEAVAADKSSLGDWSRKILRDGNMPRYLHDLSLLEKYHRGGKILEIGSAPYHVTFMMKELGHEVTGIDIDPERQAGFIAAHELDIIKCNIETEALPFEDGQFHYIIFNEIFEHLRINPVQTLREINRVLHPDGYLAMSTPNLYSIRNVVLFLLGKGYDSPYEEFHKLETIGHMGHVREYSVRQVKEFLNNTGFESVEVQLRTINPMKGFWLPFNLLRQLFPLLKPLQIHISRKNNV